MGKIAPKKGKKGNRRAGNVRRIERRDRRTKVYFSTVKPGRKLLRVFKSSGADAAKRYADEAGIASVWLAFKEEKGL